MKPSRTVEWQQNRDKKEASKDKLSVAIEALEQISKSSAILSRAIPMGSSARNVLDKQQAMVSTVLMKIKGS
jgi:hypothetical protein